MPLFRAFIAIEVPVTVQDYLSTLAKELKETCKSRYIRWIDPHNIHLTLKFLGEIPTDSLDQIQAVMAQEVSKYAKFEVRVGGLGGFPSLRQPNVLWIGVNAPTYLGLLQNDIDSSLAKVGFPNLEKAFSPHLTLARIAREANPNEVRQIGTTLTAIKSKPLVAFHVENIVLFSSTLHPSGAVYNPVFTYSLK